MKNDGSQYDRVFPWDEDQLLLTLEEALAALAALAAAKTPTEKANAQDRVDDAKRDLWELHGIVL
jgi:hypothetical protein